MKGFSGFPQKGRLVRVPGLFFSELLPQIDSLAEMKVTLYCFWRLQQKEGAVPYLRLREMLADSAFLSGLAARDDELRAALQDGLERAAARGTLLHVQVQGDGWEEDLYFMNTPRGQAAVGGIERGEWMPGIGPGAPVELTVERPNLFTLYEQNVGPLTPIIADRLRDLEASYSQAWIEEAFEIAVKYNKRSLSYIEAILNRWQTEGREEREGSAGDGQRFIGGKFRDEIEY